MSGDKPDSIADLAAIPIQSLSHTQLSIIFEELPGTVCAEFPFALTCSFSTVGRCVILVADFFGPLETHPIVKAQSQMPFGVRRALGIAKERIMDQQRKLALALIIGATVGAAAVHGLHAQAKPKAYIVTESQIVDAAAAAVYGPRNQAAQKAAGGTSFRTTGKITAVVGTPPSRVGLSEWTNVDAAQAWLASERRKDLDTERDKAIKIIRQFIVEAAN